MTSEYIKKLIDDLFAMNEERKQENSSVDVEELINEIFTQKEEDNYKAFAHIFICINNEIANEVNIFPKDIAEVVNNLVFVKKVDEFTETKESVSITTNGQTYNVPMKYSYSFSFVK